MNSIVRMLLGVLLVLIALALGLLVRHLLVKRFKDNSLLQILAKTFGTSVLLLLLLLALALGAVIVSGNADLLGGLLGFGNTGTTGNLLQASANVLWKIALTCVLCLFGLMQASVLRAALLRRLGERGVSINVRTLIGRLCYGVVLALVFLIVLAIWDVELALPAVIVTGVLTFTFNGLIRDLVSGVLLLVDQPFQMGDQITIQSATGTVTTIHLRVTSIRLRSGAELIIPNGRFLDENVINHTRYEDRSAVILAVFAQADYQANETPHLLLQAIKSAGTVSSAQEPTITLLALSGRVKGYQAAGGGYNNQTLVLTLGFWVSSREPHAVMEVLEALGEAFPSADFSVREFAGNRFPAP